MFSGNAVANTDSEAVVSAIALPVCLSYRGANISFVGYIWAMTRQNVSSGVSDQTRHKPACAATEAS